mmetsp:Transcript_5479/g.7635  ORF Transcript_5479/g.7635 Transcript_5479/m.7635 type:complete len:399 (-) Transcript_5479:167-1363(-)|eukprot:CAMPEP_0184485558 /NCGR_PEP_ID=MMETSP0113_2-20130426/7140_1 /TAXON_ID=91329 /ORGANISM="Norrisiella sphaerica, Strain BC52" /LENGTH=398 /DNA_ID=CAMNT_0026867037 /DNA_START=310 /DNA_END=1506 /DNA_ORIENTATION=+
MGQDLACISERSKSAKAGANADSEDGMVKIKTMDVRDEYGKWVLGEITEVQLMVNKVHVHFPGWDPKWDLILDKEYDCDRFAPAGKYSEVEESCEFKESDNVLVLRRKPKEASGKWVQGYVRKVRGPQVQVQYTYRGITFHYWYHYNQAEIHTLKDCERWVTLQPSSKMETLPDGKSGFFGKEIMNLLFSRKAPPLKRVGAHADGTCFFHAVFHSLNAKDPAFMRKGRPGRDEEAKYDKDASPVSYRELSSQQRAFQGREWRRTLRSFVEKEWFDKNLGCVCDWKSYLQQYEDVKYSTGPTHNMHVACFFDVNIFFVSFYTHPETKEGDFFVRISSPDGAAQYNRKKPSIILFHRAHGEVGHYESIQTDEPGEKFGQGVFQHGDHIIQHLLSKANTLM